ncbi:acetoacetate decarboxylase family protein [Mycobacterium sp. BMJ-28]
MAIYVGNRAAVASAREVSGLLKKLSFARLDLSSHTLNYSSLWGATATMGFKHRTLGTTDAPDELARPAFTLKMICGRSIRRRTCELVSTRITEVTIKRTGCARLQPFAHVMAGMAGMADLPVLDIVDANPRPDRPAPECTHRRLRRPRPTAVAPAQIRYTRTGIRRTR